MSKITEQRNIPFSPPDISELEINEVVAALRLEVINVRAFLETID